MNLTGIVSVTGKPGLYKVMGQNKAGFILESLDGQKTKQVINPNARIAALNEVTVFGREDDIRLKDILLNMKENSDKLSVPDAKADSRTLKSYFTEIAPDHDDEQVYVSDIKKIVSWYKVISGLPLFNEADPADKPEEVEEKDEKAG